MLLSLICNKTTGVLSVAASICLCVIQLSFGRFGDGGRKCFMRKKCMFLKYFEG